MWDWVRLWRDSLRLNLRKRHYRRRSRLLIGGRAPTAPCQSPSDDGRALHTSCQACLNLDRPSRYRWICPDLRFVSGEPRCGCDARDVRPYWRRGLTCLLAPPVVVTTLAVLGVWLGLRHAMPAHPPALADLLWPPRWQTIDTLRRRHYLDLATRAMAANDHPAATVALFAAAQTPGNDPVVNTALARLAALGGYHSLVDELHATNLRAADADPSLRARLAVAWLDDLLITCRPREIIRLSLDQLARPEAPRDLWLRAFFEACSAPGEARLILGQTPLVVWPHPALEHALRARAALDDGNVPAASAELLAFAERLPGPPARRFLARSWAASGHLDRAFAAALDPRHPDPIGDAAVLRYELEHAAGRAETARGVALAAWSRPETRPALRAALIRHPDPDLISVWARDETAPPALAALWLATRLAGRPDRAADLARRLGQSGHVVPDELIALDLSRDWTAFATRVAGVLPCDRDTLWALRSRSAESVPRVMSYRPAP